VPEWANEEVEQAEPGRILGYQAVSRYILDDSDEDRRFALRAAREGTQW